MNDADMMNAYGARKIVTTHIFPPIPDRNHDWCAHFDGEEERGNYGLGVSVETLDAACERIKKLEDLARNIAGIDDFSLNSADLNVVRFTMKEWRDQARDLMK
jgi:hypothetical protein